MNSCWLDTQLRQTTHEAFAAFSVCMCVCVCDK